MISTPLLCPLSKLLMLIVVAISTFAQATLAQL